MHCEFVRDFSCSYLAICIMQLREAFYQLEIQTFSVASFTYKQKYVISYKKKHKIDVWHQM